MKARLFACCHNNRLRRLVVGDVHHVVCCYLSRDASSRAVVLPRDFCGCYRDLIRYPCAFHRVLHKQRDWPIDSYGLAAVLGDMSCDLWSLSSLITMNFLKLRTADEENFINFHFCILLSTKNISRVRGHELKC